MLGRLFQALSTGDVAEVERMLADAVESWSDGGGTYAAARVVVRGPRKVATLYTNLQRLYATTQVSSEVTVTSMNGSAAVVLRNQPRPEWADRVPPVVIMPIDTDDDGRVLRFFTVLAPGKLGRATDASLR